MKFEHTEVMNLEGAIRGMRNSFDSHAKSDSGREVYTNYETYEEHYCEFEIGPNDLKLAQSLCKAGSSHAKFMRQILVSVDITAPLYWWKQFDQYKVGTVTNSESTMHRVTAREFRTEQFALLNDDEMVFDVKGMLIEQLINLNFLRAQFLGTKDKRYWKAIVQLLPDGWLQKRTTTLNYAVLANIYHDRKRHKLSEWQDVCKWIAELPYSELITGG